MTIYRVETWSPGPPVGAWRELASTRDRAAAIAAMTAYARSRPPGAASASWPAHERRRTGRLHRDHAMSRLLVRLPEVRRECDERGCRVGIEPAQECAEQFVHGQASAGVDKDSLRLGVGLRGVGAEATVRQAVNARHENSISWWLATSPACVS